VRSRHAAILSRLRFSGLRCPAVAAARSHRKSPEKPMCSHVSGEVWGQIAVANVGYARVSTIDQDPALQLNALACGKVFEDRASGARADRSDMSYDPHSNTCLTATC
jgi:hypothetical protein